MTIGSPYLLKHASKSNGKRLLTERRPSPLQRAPSQDQIVHPTLRISTPMPCIGDGKVATSHGVADESSRGEPLRDRPVVSPPEQVARQVRWRTRCHAARSRSRRTTRSRGVPPRPEGCLARTPRNRAWHCEATLRLHQGGPPEQRIVDFRRVPRQTGDARAAQQE